MTPTRRRTKPNGTPTTSETPEAVLWTEKETARHIGFDVRTLQSWRMKGTGPQFVRISSRCIRYRPEDIQAWIEERLRRSTSDFGDR